MISLSHVYKTFSNDHHALCNLNLEVQRGEFVFLTGPSGAGKTTLFRMISAFDRITSGSIEVAGFDLGQISGRPLIEFRRRIGVVFQDYRLLKDRSVFDNIALPLRIRGEKETHVERKVNSVLKQVGLFEHADKNPLTLSGGEQQRVAIARAIVHQPEVLVADEPTGNLDAKLANDIMDLFERVNAQGTTVFIATHDQAMVQSRMKRSLRLISGQVAEEIV